MIEAPAIAVAVAAVTRAQLQRRASPAIAVVVHACCHGMAPKRERVQVEECAVFRKHHLSQAKEPVV